MKIQAILWDNDGVLLDSETAFFSLTKQCFAQKGLDLESAFWAQYFLGFGERTYQIAMRLGISEKRASELAEWRDHLWYERLLQPVETIPQVEKTLHFLAEKYRMAVVTGAPRSHFTGLHRHHDLLKYFEFCITQDECAQVKPQPDAYLQAAQKLGVSPSQCLVVEDSPRGLRAAKDAGMRCAILRSTLLDETQCQEADDWLDSLSDLCSESWVVKG